MIVVTKDVIDSIESMTNVEVFKVINGYLIDDNPKISDGIKENDVIRYCGKVEPVTELFNQFAEIEKHHESLKEGKDISSKEELVFIRIMKKDGRYFSKIFNMSGSTLSRMIEDARAILAETMIIPGQPPIDSIKTKLSTLDIEERKIMEDFIEYCEVEDECFTFILEKRTLVSQLGEIENRIWSIYDYNDSKLHAIKSVTDEFGIAPFTINNVSEITPR